MKKTLFILAAAVCFAFLHSCSEGTEGQADTDGTEDARDENEPGQSEELKSLDGTIWKSDLIESEGGWTRKVLTFTDGIHVTFTFEGDLKRVMEGTYEFDHPKITLHMENIHDITGETYISTTIGDVKGHNMTGEILTGDIVRILELELQ